MPTALIVGASSDIGRELAVRYLAKGWEVWGTYRNPAALPELPRRMRLERCDVSSNDSISAAVTAFEAAGLRWDVIVVGPGTEEPIGNFWECDADAWETGIRVNALGPLRMLRQLYPLRNAGGRAAVAFFSGSGTNNAANSYSAYAASKIFLMKMCELLDAETRDVSFFIVGPGVVRTKIHRQTVEAGEKSGANYDRVVRFLGSSDPGTGHDDVFDCIQWCVEAGREVVGGRNISLVWDAWRNGGKPLADALRNNADLYKLRRYGNDLRIEGMQAR